MINPRRWWPGIKYPALAALAVILVGGLALPGLSGRPPALGISHPHLVMSGARASLHDHNQDEPAEMGKDGIISLFQFPGLQDLSLIAGGHLALPALSLLPLHLTGIAWLFRQRWLRPAAVFLSRLDRPPLS
jgi:hypothetical protein